MAMTDEERAELKKLSQDDLIEVLGQFREAAEKQRKAERDSVIKRFLNGVSSGEDHAEDDEGDIFDMRKNEAFKTLKQRFSGR